MLIDDLHGHSICYGLQRLSYRWTLDDQSNISERTYQSASGESNVRRRSPTSSATTPSLDVALQSRSSKRADGSVLDIAEPSSASSYRGGEEGAGDQQPVASSYVAGVLKHLEAAFDIAIDLPQNGMRAISYTQSHRCHESHVKAIRGSNFCIRSNCRRLQPQISTSRKCFLQHCRNPIVVQFPTI